MKLNAFRIRNFKSIIDTGWCNLSSDNITGLIGQNESGKSSVLEALNCFYTGEISEDYLRSDETYPQVYCSFHLSDAEIDRIFSNIIDLEKTIMPQNIIAKLKEKNRINVTRSWNKNTEMDESILSIEEDDLIKALTWDNNILHQFLEEKKINTLIKDGEIEDGEIEDGEIEDEETEDEETEDEEETILNYDNIAYDIFNFLPNFDFFEDFGSLLPNTMDLKDFEDRKTKEEGYKGVENFLTIVGVSIDDLKSKNLRVLENKLHLINQEITKGFRTFWKQKLGKTNKIGIEFEIKHYPESVHKKIAGNPYLVFWITDGQEKLYPKQRSQGVRWFLSFYLQLMASAKRDEGGKDTIFLIDEPGNNLHAIAQRDVLEVLDTIKNKIQVIYTTHAPHLIDLENIHRLLAVQRNEEEDNNVTKIYNAHQLGAASKDTLSPLFTLIGAKFSDQTVIKKTNNIILEEISAYYYLLSFWKLAGKRKEISFIPATGTSNVPLFAHMFLGWGLEFIVIVDDEPSGRKVYNELKKNLFGDNETIANKKLLKIKNCNGIEDMFSRVDFLKYILVEDGLDIESVNSQYLNEKGISKAIKALEFSIKVKDGKIQLKDLEEETKNKINTLVQQIDEMLG